MKKLLTTLALTLGLLFGGVSFLASPASADPCAGGVPCPTEPPCVGAAGEPCPPESPVDPPCIAGQCPATTAAGLDWLLGELNAAEQTANDYRQQVAALTAKADRLQRIADRRAETITRLRAKIRALR